MNHMFVLVSTPYSEPIGLRVKNNLIVDSDPRLAWAQGRAFVWFEEWVKRRQFRGWRILSTRHLEDSPPMDMIKRDLQ